MRKVGLAAILLSVACGAAGCATRTTAAPAATPSAHYIGPDELRAGLAEQAAVLARGRIGRTEYAAAVQRFRQCLEKHDVHWSSPGWNPVDQRFVDYSYRNDALADDVVLGYADECQTAHLDRVQTAYAAVTPPSMDARVLAKAQKCLTGAGLPVDAADRSVADLLGTAGAAARRTVSDCVGKSAQQLFPDRTITVGM